MAKVGADLLALHAEYQAQLQQTSGQGAAASAFQSSNTIAPIAGRSVVIDTAARRGEAETRGEIPRAPRDDQGGDRADRVDLPFEDLPIQDQ